jgi:hypothetical protein
MQLFASLLSYILINLLTAHSTADCFPSGSIPCYSPHMILFNRILLWCWLSSHRLDIICQRFVSSCICCRQRRLCSSLRLVERARRNAVLSYHLSGRWIGVSATIGTSTPHITPLSKEQSFWLFGI